MYRITMEKNTQSSFSGFESNGTACFMLGTFLPVRGNIYTRYYKKKGMAERVAAKIQARCRIPEGNKVIVVEIKDDNQ